MSITLSQAQVIGRPQVKTWDDYEAGCLASFGGGHRDDGHLEAFQHGMSTVFNLLRGEFPSAETCIAAPDLLEALEISLQAMQANIAYANYKDEPALKRGIEAARAAIAKAKGTA